MLRRTRELNGCDAYMRVCKVFVETVVCKEIRCCEVYKKWYPFLIIIFIGEDTNTQYKYKYTIGYPEVKEILEKIAEVCGELLSTSCVPLEEAETRVRDLMLRSGQKLLQVCVSESSI